MQPPSHERILLVDDDSVTRLITASILAKHGFVVDEAGSGPEALEHFRNGPDCVLLDALMPGMDGFATCRAMRSLPGGANVPVLMLTGLDDEDSVAHAYDAGATDFFVKSTQWTLLAQRTRYLLRAAGMRSELEASRAKLARAQRIARLGSWEWHVGDGRLLGSDLCNSILGISGHLDLRLADFRRRVHPDDLAQLDAELGRLMDSGHDLSIEFRIENFAGQAIHVRIDGEAERGADGRPVHVTGTIQDVTQRRQAEEQIRALANFDTLTGLPNRRMFGERFSAAIELARRRNGRLAALFVDLDRFKQINDSQGHAVGDLVLREVADRLRRCVRSDETDGDAVARLGGDEFVVLLTEVGNPDHPGLVAERILKAMRRPFTIAGRDNFISASVGIARFPEDGDNAEALLRNADAAMYSVKGQGRNNVAAYRPELNLADRKRWELEQALHKALEREELVLHYQPQIDARAGTIPGVEALMRWQHGGRLVPPGDFIPIAEETGLIVPFGEWALETAARQAADWLAAGLQPVRVAVNIPGVHFQREGFVEFVRDLLVRNGIPGHLLELEITETMLMADLSATVDTLARLARLQVRLSIDDFGTGYSSLSYLKKFAIDQLKIDRSFVTDLKPDSDNEAITGAIIAMANALNLETIAEGVETREQMRLLQRRGCHLMQGYFFSRPVPAAEVTRLIEDNQASGPKAEWKLGDNGRIMTLVPALDSAVAA
ncbi:MAG: EAL domain-containing protein [Burkholderiales bacterium]|nr:EAL domain-containing protein [Burkholderiales bacterium]